MFNAAIVGLGRWGRTLVDSVQGRSRRFRFVRAVARTPAKVADYCVRHGLPVDSDLESALKDPAVQAVAFATPHSQHLAQIRATARAGKHVFMEKPMMLKRADAVRAVDACAKAGVLLAVGHNRHFLPATRALKKLVAAGALGDILHVEGTFSGPTAYRTDPGHWRMRPDEAPGGGMTARGVHVTDMMMSLLGPVVEVDAISERRVLKQGIDDTTAMLLRFASGATGYLSTIMVTADAWRLRLFGSRGWAEMNGYETLTTCLIDGKPRTRVYPRIDMERAELEAFADACAGRRPFPVSTGIAIRNASLLEAVVRSAAVRRPVAVR